MSELSITDALIVVRQCIETDTGWLTPTFKYALGVVVRYAAKEARREEPDYVPGKP